MGFIKVYTEGAASVNRVPDSISGRATFIKPASLIAALWPITLFSSSCTLLATNLALFAHFTPLIPPPQHPPHVLTTFIKTPSHHRLLSILLQKEKQKPRLSAAHSPPYNPVNSSSRSSSLLQGTYESTIQLLKNTKA